MFVNVPSYCYAAFVDIMTPIGTDLCFVWFVDQFSISEYTSIYSLTAVLVYLVIATFV